jgi:hypothetical protein
LEGREVPALISGGLIAPAMPYPVGQLCQTGSPARTATMPMQVTVAENTPQTVLEMGPIFATVPGLQHDDGLRYSVLGNTNAALVRTALSDSALTLTYSGGQYGTARITVCATDADGVSVQQSILVTVRPLSLAPAPTAIPRIVWR